MAIKQNFQMGRHIYICGSILLLCQTAFSNPSSMPQPVLVGEHVNVKSSAPRVAAFEQLSTQEKQLAYHLTRAGSLGRMIAFYQSHRHAPVLHMLFEDVFDPNNRDDTLAILNGDMQVFNELLRYAAIFEEKLGPYNGANRKYLLQHVTAEHVTALFERYIPKAPAKIVKEVAKLLTDPRYEVLQQPEHESGEGLQFAGGNLYGNGITGEEVENAVAQGLQVQANCRIARSSSGLSCVPLTTRSRLLPRYVRETLEGIVSELEEAKRYALHPQQAEQIQHLIAYFTTGDMADFEQFNIAWLQLPTLNIDLMGGPVETYGDYRNIMASWEWYVLLVDPTITQMSKAIASQAAAFEAKMPYPDSLRKQFAPDYAPQALMTFYLQESLAGMRTLGFNLPNDDRIRQTKGFKNVIRLDFPEESHSNNDTLMEFLREFAPAARVDSIAQHYTKALQLKVLLHEIIGHGSGKIDHASYHEGEKYLGEMGKLGSALEEQRADLAALTFADDAILIQTGFFAHAEEAATIKRALYDAYLVNFYQRFSKKRTFDQAHTRGQLLFITTALREGAIEFVAKDGSAVMTEDNQVLAVKDVDQFQQTARALLGRLQDIKAYRKEAELQMLFATDAPLGTIAQPWAQAVLKRAEPLKANQETVEEPWEIVQRGPDTFQVQLLGTGSLETVVPGFAFKEMHAMRIKETIKKAVAKERT